MEALVRMSYAFEILLGELIFLQAYPRRPRFPLRLALAAAVSLAAGYFLYSVRMADQVLSFFGFLTTICLTVVGMYFTFKGSFLNILSACVAGVACQHIGFHLSRLIALLPWIRRWNSTLELICVLSFYAVICLTLGRVIRQERYYEYTDARITAVSVVIILICIGITRFVRLAGDSNFYTIICTSLYAITCCALALFIQFFLYYFVRVKSEYLVLRRINEEERRQYETSRENAEQLSIKYHDLKHKLISLEGKLPQAELDSMRSIIETYDSTYHTGLDVLDIILNEKNTRCRSRGISLTCMGYGGELGFMETMDIYSLFGNIIDNAIAAVEKLEPPEKRVISLVIERKGSFIYIDAVNFAGGAAPSFTDGLPDTTKAEERGFHGYGLKSVRQIARKYHGDVSVSIEDDVFKVSVYMVDGKLPDRENEEE